MNVRSLRRKLGWLMTLGIALGLILVAATLLGVGGMLVPRALDWRVKAGSLCLIAWFASLWLSIAVFLTSGAAMKLISAIGLLFFVLAWIFLDATLWPYLPLGEEFWPFIGLAYLFYLTPLLQAADILLPRESLPERRTVPEP